MTTDKYCSRDIDFTTSEIVPTSHNYTNEDIRALEEKYPDVMICKAASCGFTTPDHEIMYEYDQHNADMAKSGTIRVMYKIIDFHPEYKSERTFDWYNGKKWITLSQ